METACAKGLFHGQKIGNNGPTISHLFYADDAIFVGEGSKNNMCNLARILRCFHASSGLQVNFHKSKVFGIGASSTQIQSWASFLRCLPGTFPFTYLGVPVGANMNLKKNWLPVIDRFNAKLSGWKAKNLSFGGRLTLVKSVLSSLPLYYFSLFKAPNCIIDRLEQIRRRFLWGGADKNKKISWVAWSTVMASKDRGGLVVGSLKAQNCALLIKWWHKLKDGKGGCIWKDVVNEIYCLKSKPNNILSKKNAAGAWSSIAKTEKYLNGGFGVNFSDVFSIRLGAGNQILFWKDIWVGDTTLELRFPSLFAIESNKVCLVMDRISTNGFSWSWKQGLNNSILIDEFYNLLHVLAPIRLLSNPDKLECKLTIDGKYIVQNMRRLIDDKITTVGFLKMPWVRMAPIKVNCFVWRVGLGRIPVTTCLKDRGVIVDSVLCKMCGTNDESVDHAMVLCPKAMEVWRWIFGWCGILLHAFSSAVDILEFGAKWGKCPKKRKILITIIQGTVWNIWKVGNDLIFNKIHKSHTAIAGEIISVRD